jgi:hypothetical protein
MLHAWMISPVLPEPTPPPRPQKPAKIHNDPFADNYPLRAHNHPSINLTAKTDQRTRAQTGAGARN